MLAVNERYRKRGLGQELVRRVIERMVNMGCDEIVLETEVSFILDVKSSCSFYRLMFLVEQ